MALYFVVCLAHTGTVKYFEDNESITIAAIKNLDLQDTALICSGGVSDKICQERLCRV